MIPAMISQSASVKANHIQQFFMVGKCVYNPCQFMVECRFHLPCLSHCWNIHVDAGQLLVIQDWYPLGNHPL